MIKKVIDKVADKSGFNDLLDPEIRCSRSYKKVIGKYVTGINQQRAVDSTRKLKRIASFGDWAVCENSVMALAGKLEEKKNVRIVEFGAGVSTLFFENYFGERLRLDTFEHIPDFADKMKSLIKSPNVKVHNCGLWRYSDDEFRSIMSGKISPDKIYDLGSHVDKSEFGDTRIKNTFYKIDKLEECYDAMIIDGPHGNGRSIAFAALRDRLADPGWILIDDCNHYPFIHDCAQFFEFTPVFGEMYPGKNWILLRTNRKAN